MKQLVVVLLVAMIGNLIMFLLDREKGQYKIYFVYTIMVIIIFIICYFF